MNKTIQTIRPLKAGLALILLATTQSVLAGKPEVLKAEFSLAGGADQYRASVTVRHADTGWEHYADNFEVLTLDGELLNTRVLYHPHVDEQPFTRSSSSFTIPSGIKEVLIRAHDSEHGYGEAIKVTVPNR